ncbi:MAG TPA: hypothetical protein ENO05_01330 [Bacteroides sp.]|nr:hypothetical protein [Bacteroides sp.]
MSSFMKGIFVALVALLAAEMPAQKANVIFLHHSTGGMIYEGGNVADSVAAYNQREGTEYTIKDWNFPYKPYEWANYPYDYWNIWINGYCEDYRGEKGYVNVMCLDDLSARYDVVIFKHCFPGADILEDTGNPDISSVRKSLENYKLQYRALRDAFASFPETQFVVWTLAPRHRLYPGTTEHAGRAGAFVDWVKSEWLQEEGKRYENIHVFDYFSLSATLDPEADPPAVQHCLKYKYEKEHDHHDSHPNELACKEIGPEFYRFIRDLLESEFGKDPQRNK